MKEDCLIILEVMISSVFLRRNFSLLIDLLPHLDRSIESEINLHGESSSGPSASVSDDEFEDMEHDEEEDLLEFNEILSNEESNSIDDNWSLDLANNHGPNGVDERYKIHGTIIKCRNVVMMTKKSSVLGNYIDQLRNSLNVTRAFSLDCPTRWNSTFYLVESFLISKTLLAKLFGEKNLLNIRKDLSEKMAFFELQRNDWLLLLDLHTVLKLFELATKLMSGKKYPTAGLCYYVIVKLKAYLTDINHDNQSIKYLKQMLLDEFDHYFYSNEEQLKLLQVINSVRLCSI